MIFTETPIAGAWLIELEPIGDERGWFARTFDVEQFRTRGLHPTVRQTSLSFNHRAGTLRGLHYQAEPHGEDKLVRCTAGAIFDVIVDLREGSTSYLDWFGVELKARKRRMIYAPPGVAHGFQTLTDETEVHYQMSVDHRPESASGVRWDDPELAIDWPEAERIVSERDRSLPTLAERRALADARS